MKKVLFVLAICGAVLFANAQEKKDAPKNEAKPKTEQTIQKPMKTQVKEAELIQPIKDNIAKEFDGATFVRANKMEMNEKVSYIIIVKKDNVDWKLIYDKDGKLLNKKEMKIRENKGEVKKLSEPVKATEQPKK